MNVATAPLLEVRDLKVHFPFKRGTFLKPERGFVRAVDGVSFTLREGETLGLVGESGCGKSTTARACLNLVNPTGGEVLFQGRPIQGLGDREMLPLRGEMQMIFQDPFASLNPRMTVGKIVGEPLSIFNGGSSRRDRELEVMRLLELVGLNPRFLNRYPHEFSGGQRQRIGIARALAVRPKLIFCDEPVSALDVSIQAQVVNLLEDLQQKLGLAYVFIAHDLAVVRHICDRVGVMYLGRIVELGTADEIYGDPRHPYTQALLSAVPEADPAAERRRKRIVLKGEVPSPDKQYPGCPFADRCPIVQDVCKQSPPPLVQIENAAVGHAAACFFARENKAVRIY
ncbi:MAG: ATP-binding cassette domain-containing protein [Planctomycetaceae bacterium]|nr:ATP-binding cassette domain-containing protein [Planctomycetaceae bacterium]